MKKSENNKESTSSSSSSCPESISSGGCGTSSTDISSSSSAAVVVAGYAPINLNITTTTGGNFSVLVDVQNSVENLKKIIAKKLKVAKDRICLLHRERELQDGNLRENGLVDGSKIILIPNVETGLLAQRPENTVMQALESLNDAQVNDFLSGKTPLNLSMRLGDHMMLIQLQLSTVSPSSPPHTRSRPRSRSGRSSSSSSSSSSFNSTSCTSTNCTAIANNEFQSQPQQQQQHQQQQHQSHHHTNGNKKSDILEHKNSSGLNQGVSTSLQSNSAAHYPDAVPTSSSSTTIKSSIPDGELESFLNRHGFESIDDIVKNFSFPDQQQLSSKTSCGDIKQQTTTIVNNCCSTKPTATATQYTNSAAAVNYSTAMDQSPIKSLSNLVSNPLKSTPGKNIQTAAVNNSSSSSSHIEDLSSVSHIERASMCSDPISAKLTSCLCKRLDGTATASNNTTTTSTIGRECDTNQCQSRQEPLQTETVPTQMITDCSSTAHQQMITSGIPINTLNSSKSYNTHSSSSSSSSSSSLLHKTVNNPIGKSKHRYHSSACNVLKKNLVTFDRKHNNSASKDFLLSSSSSLSSSTSVSSSSLNCVNGSNNEIILDEATRPSITATDARALAEASRNLTQTLRKLSKEVFTNKVDLSDQTPRKSNSGAVIESMKNHGKGIYSGTFSGTLNPALQDQYGRPKRDISTVIHILNDLLSATPQYNRDTRINFESSSSSTTLASFSSGRSSNRQSAKHNFSTTEQECKKCINNSSKTTNTSCAYGECNGHASFSSSSLLNASNSSTVATGTVSDGHHYTMPFNNCQDSVSTALSSSSLNVSGTNDSSLSDMKTLTDERNLCCMCNGSYRNLSEICNNDISSSGSSSSNGIIVSTDNTANSTTSMKMCNKCSIDLENSKTKCKLDQIRLVMQQRKQKREARKLKSTPYGGGRILGTVQHNNNSSNSSTSNDSNGDNGNTGNSNDIANGGNNGNGNINTTVIANNGSGQSASAVGNNNASNNNSNNINNSNISNANGTATSSPPATAVAPAASAATTANTITSIAPPSEVSPNHIVEEVDTAA